MSINGINAYTNMMAQVNASGSKKTSKSNEDSSKTTETGFNDVAAVYEKSDVDSKEVSKAELYLETAYENAQSAASDVNAIKDLFAEDTESGDSKKSSSTDRTAIIKQMKSDLEAQKQSMINMVKEALGQQASTFAISGNDDDVWKYFAKGDFSNVTEAAKAEAAEAVSEDGYWGVEKTSDRIVEFAKALAGDDVSKADSLFEAFKKGYEQATNSWGTSLPDISSKTFEAVEKKFNEWKNSAADTTSDTTSDTTE